MKKESVKTPTPRKQMLNVINGILANFLEAEERGEDTWYLVLGSMNDLVNAHKDDVEMLKAIRYALTKATDAETPEGLYSALFEMHEQLNETIHEMKPGRKVPDHLSIHKDYFQQRYEFDIIFLDGDKTNCNLNNLRSVPRKSLLKH